MFDTQHTFVKDVAIELEANKGTSVVLKRMVERLMIRRQELAKRRKEVRKSDNGADFGNTIINPNEARIRDSDLSDAGTIVQYVSSR